MTSAEPEISGATSKDLNVRITLCPLSLPPQEWLCVALYVEVRVVQQAVGAPDMDDDQVLAGRVCTVKMLRQPVLHAPFATDLSRWAGFVASHT